jgi:cellobiose-specific phosphotransferase system component IIC
MLPMLLRVKVRDESHNFGFYFPMVLIYLLFIPVIIIGTIVFTILLLIPDTARQARSYLQLVFALPTLLSASIGTEIAIQSDTQEMLIRIT